MIKCFHDAILKYVDYTVADWVNRFERYSMISTWCLHDCQHSDIDRQSGQSHKKYYQRWQCAVVLQRHGILTRKGQSEQRYWDCMHEPHL